MILTRVRVFAGGSLRNGHRSHECNIGPNKCHGCGSTDHRPAECPKNGNSLVNMIANRKYEVSDFAKQKAGPPLLTGGVCEMIMEGCLGGV